MKKVLFAAVSALAVSVAIAADSTQFGVMKVPSNDKETIVAVPWLESGTGSDSVVNAVTVSNLVLTSGLKVGDQLLYYKDGAYTGWEIAENPTTNVKYWTPAQNVSLNGTSVSAASDDVRIPRGGAVILKRESPDTDEGGFYIMGKPSGDAATIDLVANGYSLVAPPAVTNTDVNAMTWTGIKGQTDSLIVADGNGGATTFVWKNSVSKWAKKNDSGAWTTEGVMIPAGTGAWFKNGEDKKKSVMWK